MTICPLNLCMFSSGMLRGFWEVPLYSTLILILTLTPMLLLTLTQGTYTDLMNQLVRRGEKMHALHANYVSGNENKAQALSNHGYSTSSLPSFLFSQCFVRAHTCALFVIAHFILSFLLIPFIPFYALMDRLWLATESSKNQWNGICKTLRPKNASLVCDESSPGVC